MKISFKSFIAAGMLLAILVAAFGYCALPVKASEGSRYVIRLREDADPSVLENYGTGIRRVFSFSKSPELARIYAMDSELTAEKLSASLFGTFEYLEQETAITAGTVLTNDPGFTADFEDIDRQWGLVKAGFPEGWMEEIGSVSNIVAIIDTGIDATHEDLRRGHWVEGYDFLANTVIPAGTDSDDNGHGTLVAGILGATANNGIGIAGTNWAISIMPIKSLDSEGRGDSAQVAEGIVWAVDHGAMIINLSLGGIGFDHDTTLAEAIAYAYNKGAIIVAAAGNDVAKTGGNLDVSPVFPICDDNDVNMIIGVVATDQNDGKADFSNYGKGCVDVTAPGKRILSTINHDPVTQHPAPDSYAFASGTSLAVPFVSGQAALLWTKFPELTNTQIRDRILSTADSVDNLNPTQCGGMSCKGMLGAGRINVPKSMQAKEDAPAVKDGDLVRLPSSGAIYQVIGGQKRPVSPFVFNQRFSSAVVRNVSKELLERYPEGPYATPQEGTLVKADQSPAVYVISKGLKLPVSYQVFVQRSMNFDMINTVSVSELDSWVAGNFLPPVEGTLVKTPDKKTVYWVVSQALHPVNYAFYTERGLEAFPLISVSEGDLAGFPKGESFIK